MTTLEPTPPRLLVVSAMYPRADDPVRGIVVQREVEGLRAAGLGVRVIGKEPGWRGYLRQASLLRKLRGAADVIHAHYGTTGFVAAFCAPGHPLVITMHGSDIALGPRPRLSKYWVQYLLSVGGASRAGAIIVQDDTMLGRLPRRLRGRAVILGQSVRLPEPSERARRGVLFLSDRHRPVKRFDLAQAAMAAVPRAGCLDSLDAHQPHEIPGAMAEARVGLLTSEREGTPVAVKEALAAGLRVVSVDLPGLRTLAGQAPEALTLTDHDPSAIAGAVSDALAAPPLGPVAQRGIHEVLREFGWTEPDRTQRLVRLYDRLLRESPRRPR